MINCFQCCFNFAFNFNLRRYNAVLSDTDPYLSTYSYKIYTPNIIPTPKFWIGTPLIVVGWCRLTVSKPESKAPMVSALETII